MKVHYYGKVILTEGLEPVCINGGSVELGPREDSGSNLIEF
jgi:hypothetical protein